MNRVPCLVESLPIGEVPQMATIHGHADCELAEAGVENLHVRLYDPKELLIGYEWGEVLLVFHIFPSWIRLCTIWILSPSQRITGTAIEFP